MQKELEEPRVDDYTSEGVLDHEKYMIAVWKYQAEQKLIRAEKEIIWCYGLDEKDWENTPKSIKVAIAELFNEAEKHAEQLSELEAWRDEMPL